MNDYINDVHRQASNTAGLNLLASAKGGQFHRPTSTPFVSLVSCQALGCPCRHNRMREDMGWCTAWQEGGR